MKNKTDDNAVFFAIGIIGMIIIIILLKIFR